MEELKIVTKVHGQYEDWVCVSNMGLINNKQPIMVQVAIWDEDQSVSLTREQAKQLGEWLIKAAEQ